MTTYITHRDGSVRASIPDGNTNSNATTLRLFGRGAPIESLEVSDNFIKLLDNFANPDTPDNPVPGQIWYKSDTKDVYYFNGTAWTEVTGTFNGTVGVVSMSIGNASDNVTIFIVEKEVLAVLTHFPYLYANLPVGITVDGLTLDFKARFPNGLVSGLNLASVSRKYLFNGNIALLDTGVSEGEYNRVAVDATGRIDTADDFTDFPLYGICLWARPDYVPRGFAICDGSTYLTTEGRTVPTPDLRNKFIIGAGLNYSTHQVAKSIAKVTSGYTNVLGLHYIMKISDTGAISTTTSGGGTTTDPDETTYATKTITYNTPGTYTFTVPAYATMVIEGWGAGGGGEQPQKGIEGSAGGASRFGTTLVAGGGSGGRRTADITRNLPNRGGAGGKASGANIIMLDGYDGEDGQTDNGGKGGAAPYGGAGGNGGFGVTGARFGTAGESPGGGGGGGSPKLAPRWGGAGGGGGSYFKHSYSYNQIGSPKPGTTVTVMVGEGGLGGEKSATDGKQGGDGGDGQIKISWTTQLVAEPVESKASFKQPGSYTFLVPQYTSMTVEVWGGGGGGMIPVFSNGNVNTHPTDGGTTSFENLVSATGGMAARIDLLATPQVIGGNSTFVNPTYPGLGGRGTAGSLVRDGEPGDTSKKGAGGASPFGGDRQFGPTATGDGFTGFGPGGGGSGASAKSIDSAIIQIASGGGAGGYAKKSFAPGELIPGSYVTIVVGAGGRGAYGGRIGGHGAPGEVRISWNS